MKKILLLVSSLAVAGAAYADWGTTIADPVKVFPTGTNSYATEVKAGADGTVWALIYHPDTRNAEDEFDTQNVVYEYRIQHFDKDGNPLFPDEGLLLSDYSNWSYTVVNQYLLIDSDGNAVVAVSDCRNSNAGDRSYTAYKVSPTGELLWGDEGVAISDPLKPANFLAFMNMIELEDKSYVFAWMDMNDETGSHIHMQRLNNEGVQQWSEEQVSLTNDITGYPYLVNSGYNTFIMVYGSTASYVFYARKMDFEGESVWGKDVRIYRGGWGSVPLQTQVSVKSSGDNGVIMAWTDDRAGTQIESAYLSYVTSDGRLAFSGASDEADVKLCYDDWRCFNLDAVPAADGSCFYAVWRRTDKNQNMQGIMMQKISKEGELLWGDEAKELEPIKNTSLGYISVQSAGEDGACAFYEEYRSYFDQQCLASRFDRDGNMVWENGSIALSEEERQTASLASQPLPTENAWLCTWTDGGTSAEDKATTYYMTRLFENGTFDGVDSSVESVLSPDSVLCFDGVALRSAAADGTLVNVYSPTGAQMAAYTLHNGVAEVNLPAGIYFASAKGGAAVKFVVK